MSSARLSSPGPSLVAPHRVHLPSSEMTADPQSWASPHPSFDNSSSDAILTRRLRLLIRERVAETDFGFDRGSVPRQAGRQRLTVNCAKLPQKIPRGDVAPDLPGGSCGWVLASQSIAMFFDIPNSRGNSFVPLRESGGLNPADTGKILGKRTFQPLAAPPNREPLRTMAGRPPLLTGQNESKQIKPYNWSGA